MSNRIGATGNFPKGRMNENDEGELQFAVTSSRGKVILDFGTQVVWLGLDPEISRTLAMALVKHANEAEKEPIFRASGDVACEVCGDKYYHHPHDMKQLDSQGEPFLRVRCDGRRLKL